MIAGEGKPRPEPSSKTEKDQSAATGSGHIHFLPGAIKQLFREVKTALTCDDPAPQPTQRRRNTEETRGGFTLTARKIMRRTVRLPAAAYEAATFFSETLDWMNPWHYEAAGMSELHDDYHYTEINQPFLQL
jgi:hypothetical protein